MKRFLSAYATADQWQDVVDQALKSIGTIPQDAGLGFLYLTAALSESAGRILERLNQKAPSVHWVGTVAGGICSNRSEIYDKPAIALLVTDIGESAFRIIPGLDSNPAASLTEHQKWRKQHNNFFGVIHGDPRNPKTGKLISQFAHSIDGGFLIGAISSGETKHYIQVTNEHLTEGGISGVLLSSEIPVATNLSQGCSLIGERHEITEIKQNVIRRIDDRPALEVLFEDVGEKMAADPKSMDGTIFSALHIPSSDTRDYLIRNIMGLDLHHQEVTLGDTPSVGSHIQFAKRDAQTANDDLTRMVTDLRSRVSGNIKGALYYSCCGRGRTLFGQDSEELGLIQDILGDVPLTGIFANGEVYHDQIYGFSGVLTLFPESQ